MSTKADRGVTLLTVVVLLVTLGVALGPSGAVGARIASWRLGRSQAKQVAKLWNALDSVVQLTEVGDSTPSIFEFADYECPFCRANFAMVADWNRQHPTATIGLVHYPLSIHPAAEGAARAALCAEDAGSGPQMHSELMTSETWRIDTNWVALAVKVEISDTTRFSECLHADRTNDRLARSIVTFPPKTGQRNIGGS